MDDRYFDILEDNSKVKIAKKFTREPERTEIKDEFFIDGTRHEAVVPFGAIYSPVPHEPEGSAKKYEFELDTFQKISIASIERDESVLVSAHTSCGKTVVAEYAIAQSIRNSQRVVYTSPIKALSNQKFRELQEEFKDVGLMTGDVTINPEASCLVMTTEILRNMLYRGSEVIREVHWIVFDEIHYMRDKERGVVWEETIILLPPHARMVFLSATIPNAREFAEWIAFIQSQIVHVVYTEKRVVPLIHYFLTDDLYLIKDKAFHIKEFRESMNNVPERGEMDKLIRQAVERANTPAVVFSFSRKDCETYAVKVTRDFLGPEEKELVKTIFDNAIASLREEDRNIPIIEKMLPLLQRGVGIHHSGLLPIIREIVEILFQESLLKLLFATETFSIGLNMPAKTVIFTSLRKFDGTNRRLLTSGEFIQMSGRAGRRGLDKIGVAICILTEELTVPQVRAVFSSTADRLCSAFRLTYSMILNLLRVDGLNPSFLLSRSFFHFQAYKKAVIEEAKITDVSSKEPTKLANMLLERERLCVKRGEMIAATFRDIIREKGRVVDLLVPNKGAMLPIRNGIIKEVKGNRVSVYVLTNKDIELRDFPLNFINQVYAVQCKIDMKVFNKKFKVIEFKDEINEEIREVEEKIRKECPSIDLTVCLFCGKSSRSCLVECSSRDGNDKKEINESEEDEDRITNEKETAGNKSSLLQNTTEYLKYLVESERMDGKIEELDKLKAIYHMEECNRMIEVLHRLEYIDDTSVLIKGKMASEISAGDELLITEMIFNSTFTELPLVDMVALLSCCVCEESVDGFVLGEESDRVYALLVGAAQRIVRVMNECSMKIKEDEYIGRFSYALMDVVKMWMTGRTFVEICASTKVFEGSIIRVFKRLEELLRQLSSAAAVIGNADLVDIFSQGIFQIKRDIVFANSLYL